MPMIPLWGRYATIFLHKIIIHIVCVCTCQNVGSGVVRCAFFPLASLVAGDFFVNVCSHCFVFLLFSIAKVSIKIEYPNKILLFIENLCFCSLKISGASKNCRLKITEWSKNYGLKILVRVRVCSYVCARAWLCVNSHQDATGTHTTGKREEYRQQGKNLNIYVWFHTTKKSIKKS